MRVFLFVFACICLSGVAFQRVSVEQSTSVGDPRNESALMGHLHTAMAQMDAGPSSAEYRESLEFLRAHASEVTRELRGALLEEPGSFRKWQLTYMLGELGNERAIHLLRDFLERPLPVPASPRPSAHAIDLRYAEELNSRTQAVMSTARIAVHRPELREQVVETLLEISEQLPTARATALFELQKLSVLHPKLSTPLRWQGLLSRRLIEHERQEQEIRQAKEPLCRRD